MQNDEKNPADKIVGSTVGLGVTDTKHCRQCGATTSEEAKDQCTYNGWGDDDCEGNKLWPE